MIFGLNAGKVGGGFIMLGLCMVVIDQIEFAFMAPPQPNAGARAGKRHCSDTTMTGLEEALQMSAGGPPVNTTDIMFGGNSAVFAGPLENVTVRREQFSLQERMKWIKLGEAALRSSDASVRKNFAAAAVSGAQESDRRRLAQRLSSWMPHAAKYRQSLRDAENHAVSIWRCNGPQPGQCVTTPAIAVLIYASAQWQVY
jgi:hypothetical protein